MKTSLMAIVLAVSAALPATAPAAQTPQPSPHDNRIRFVDYDPNDVVTVLGRVGADTLVMFDKDEKIHDVGGGDTDAWNLGLTTAGNGFFIKPKASSPDTNVHIVTDKRVYNIDMRLARRQQANYLTVWYRYPDQEAARRAAIADRNSARDLLNEAPAGARNRHYSVQGSSDLTPSEAWDDGTATFFRFAAHRVPPAVYSVGEDGKERMVNFNTGPDDTLAIHAIARKFVFRSGELVTCIFNESYDAAGTRPATNTASPQVERVVRKAERP